MDQSTQVATIQDIQLRFDAINPANIKCNYLDQVLNCNL